MKLQEIYEDKLEVLEEDSKDGDLLLTATFCKADEPNKNGRLYPESVLKKAIEKLSKKIEKDNAVLASAGHTTEMEINNVSHLIEDVWFNEESKTGQANIRIIPTSEGKNVSTILKHGGKLGLSMSSLGTVTKKEGYNQVNADLEIRQIDIVTSPGFEQAGFSKENIIGESLDIDRVEESTNTEKEKVEKFMKKVHEFYISSREAGLRKMSLPEFAGKFGKKFLEDEDK